MRKIIIALVILITAAAAIFAFTTSRSPEVGGVSNVGGHTYYLAGSGISSSATSFTLTSFTLPQNDYPIADGDLSDTFYLTVEPGNRTRQEFISCTTVVQNSGGTATISGCTRGLSPISPYTASTSLQFAHSGGSPIILSNPPQFYEQYAAKANNETITGQWTFDQFPVTASTSLASATTSGWVELATGAEAAASTLVGDIAGSLLAIWTGITTSTPATGANVIPVTGTDGLLDSAWISNYASSSYSVYTANTTWTKPDDFEYIIVEVVGGGGEGEEGDGGEPGAGGGGGGYSKELLTAADLTATTSIAIVVGSGGNSDADNGATGGTSSFGNFLEATGGAGGADSAGGAGGVGSNGDLNIKGNGGGSVSDASGTETGSGGGSFFGGGAPGVDATTGIAGGNYGGGGSGSYNGLDAGDGGSGVVVIQVFE